MGWGYSCTHQVWWGKIVASSLAFQAASFSFVLDMRVMMEPKTGIAQMKRRTWIGQKGADSKVGHKKKTRNDYVGPTK